MPNITSHCYLPTCCLYTHNVSLDKYVTHFDIFTSRPFHHTFSLHVSIFLHTRLGIQFVYPPNPNLPSGSKHRLPGNNRVPYWHNNTTTTKLHPHLAVPLRFGGCRHRVLSLQFCCFGCVGHLHLVDRVAFTYMEQPDP